jgi:hypothetical protein
MEHILLLYICLWNKQYLFLIHLENVNNTYTRSSLLPYDLPNEINIVLYYSNNLIFQMPLSTPFKSGPVLLINDLEINTPYNICGAHHI